MKKIPTIFLRNPEKMSEVLRDINPICKWVFDGEGKATVKYDGTCVKIDQSGYWKRREVKKGKPFPDDFVLEETDAKTGKSVGWMPVVMESNDDKYHIEAYNSYPKEKLSFGTYELCGPKINKNAEGFTCHTLVKHGEKVIIKGFLTRSFDGIKEYFQYNHMEGIVFHHPDGRMAKIKKRDFGLKR